MRQKKMRQDQFPPLPLNQKDLPAWWWWWWSHLFIRISFIFILISSSPPLSNYKRERSRNQRLSGIYHHILKSFSLSLSLPSLLLFYYWWIWWTPFISCISHITIRCIIILRMSILLMLMMLLLLMSRIPALFSIKFKHRHLHSTRIGAYEISQNVERREKMRMNEMIISGRGGEGEKK